MAGVGALEGGKRVEKAEDFRGKLQLYKVGGLSHSPAPMILADSLSISIKLLLVLHVLVSLLLILVVLMQRPKQEGLGAAFGGGVADQVWGAQTTNVLQKGTVYLGTMFMLLSLGLAILIGNQNHQDKANDPSVAATPVALDAPVDGTSTIEETPVPTEETPAPTEETPAPTEETPAPTEETPAPTEETPAPTGETPAPTEETPEPTEETPAPTEETPAPSEEAPAAAEGDAPAAPEGDVPAPDGEEDKSE